ncbi:hypothetical protein [Deinococcus sp.]|nr:hypothetical protein [Deinococcus sp.]
MIMRSPVTAPALTAALLLTAAAHAQSAAGVSLTAAVTAALPTTRT